MPRKRRAKKARHRAITDVPPAIRHYLLTGEYDASLEGRWRLFAAVCGPLGSTREEIENWDVEEALRPYREALAQETEGRDDTDDDHSASS